MSKPKSEVGCPLCGSKEFDRLDISECSTNETYCRSCHTQIYEKAKALGFGHYSYGVGRTMFEEKEWQVSLEFVKKEKSKSKPSDILCKYAKEAEDSGVENPRVEALARYFSECI